MARYEALPIEQQDQGITSQQMPVLNQPTEAYAQQESPTSGRYQSIPIELPTTQMGSSYDANQYGMGGVYAARNLPEVMLPEGVAQIARGAGSFASGALGFPGDVAKLAATGIDVATKRLGTRRGILQDTDEGGTNLAEKVPDIITSKGIKEKVVKPLLKSQSEPTSKTEELVDEGLEFLGSFIMPELALGKGLSLSKLSEGATLATAGGAAKVLTRKFIPEKDENGILPEIASLGSMLATSAFLSRGKLPGNVTKNLYKEAEASLSEPGVKTGFKLRSNDGRKALRAIKAAEEAVSSDKDASHAFSQIIEKIKESKEISASDIYSAKKLLNNHYSSLLRRNPEAAFYLNKPRELLKESLYEYGKKYNETFYNAIVKADEMHGAIKNAKSIAAFANEISPKLKNINPYVKMAVGAIPVGSFAYNNPILTAGAAVGGLTLNAIVKGIQSSMKSPLVANAYKDFLKAVASQNKAMGVKALSRMSSAMDKQGLDFEQTDYDFS